MLPFKLSPVEGAYNITTNFSPNFEMVSKPRIVLDSYCIAVQYFLFLKNFSEVEGYLKYVKKLDYEASPDYNVCLKFFKDGLKKRCLSDDGKLQFSAKQSSPKKVIQ